MRFEDPGRVYYRLPDIGYWSPENPPGLPPRSTPPTLAVEVRSPDEMMASQRRKCRFMREHGVAVYWLVDPGTRTVEIFDAAGERTARETADLEADELPDFSIHLPDLFAVLDE